MTDKAPTIAQEMAKFAGFTTNNGETVAPGKEHKGGSNVDLSEEEIAAGATLASGAAARTPAEKVADAKAAAAGGAATKVELTAEEENAALDAAKLSLKLQDGEELTKDEEDEAIASALAEKTAKARQPNRQDRAKHAQAGRRRAEARAARAESAVSALEARLAALEAGGGKAPLTPGAKGGNDDTADKEPNPKDFEFGEVDAKYIRALARYETRQELAAASSKNQKTTQTAAEAEAAAEFTVKREAFEDAALEIFDDFHEVVTDTVNLPKDDPAAWPLSIPLRDAIFDSDQGPRVIYALAQDPKEARRVNKLTAVEQVKWFVRQEIKYEAEFPAEADENKGVDETKGAGRQERQQTQVRRESKAPPPPNRNRGGSGNRSVNSATTDFAAFEALAQAAPVRR